MSVVRLLARDEVPDMIDDINHSKSVILFLDVGLPQREYFLQGSFDNLDVPFCITVGGAIDIWADAKKRTPKFIQSLGLEWFMRSMYDLSKARSILRHGGLFLKEVIFYHASDEPRVASFEKEVR